MLETDLFQCGFFELQLIAKNGILPIRTIGQIDELPGYLGRQAEQVQGGVAAGLDAPVKFAGKGSRRLIKVGAQFLAEQFAVFGVIVHPSADSANFSFSNQIRQSIIDLVSVKLSHKLTREVKRGQVSV